jgi:hypothetical protein
MYTYSELVKIKQFDFKIIISNPLSTRYLLALPPTHPGVFT